jgi:hypothetical protein
METFVPLSANVVIALLLVLAAAGGRLLSRLFGRGAATLAVLPLLDAGLLLAYVFGEDTYRGHHVTRWDAYRSPGGALGPMFVISVVLMTSCGALLAYFALERRAGVFALTALAGGVVALLLVTPTIVGFSAN